MNNKPKTSPARRRANRPRSNGAFDPRNDIFDDDLVETGYGPDHILKYVQQLTQSSLPERAVLLTRVSGASEQQKRSVEGQEADLVRHIQSLGVEIVDTYRDIGRPGHDLSRPGLTKAFNSARERNAVVVVPNLSRLLRFRNDSYRFPTTDQFKQLAELANGVPMMAVDDPRLSFRITEKLAAKTGRRRSNKQQGRPIKKMFDSRCGPKKLDTILLDQKALWFQRLGLVPADLIRCTGKPSSTVYRRWNSVSERFSHFFDGGSAGTTNTPGNKGE